MIIIIVFFAFNSCSTSKAGSSQPCSKQYSYKTNTINIKGITAKLQKAGIQYADVGIAEVSFDPKAVVATERMQQLDLLQFELCKQISSLPPADSSTRALRTSYSKALMEMMSIALKQDSSVNKQTK